MTSSRNKNSNKKKQVSPAEDFIVSAMKELTKALAVIRSERLDAPVSVHMFGDQYVASKLGVFKVHSGSGGGGDNKSGS